MVTTCREVFFTTAYYLNNIFMGFAILLLFASLRSIYIRRAYRTLEILLITYIITSDLLWSVINLALFTYNTDNRTYNVLILTIGNIVLGISITFAGVISYWARISYLIPADEKKDYLLYM
jgi:hypothetical protein